MIDTYLDNIGFYTSNYFFFFEKTNRLTVTFAEHDLIYFLNFYFYF